MRLKLGDLRLRVSFWFTAFLALLAQEGARGSLGPLFIAALLALRAQYAKGAPPTLRASDLILTAALVFLSAGLLVFGARPRFLVAFTAYCAAYQLLRR